MKCSKPIQERERENVNLATQVNYHYVAIIIYLIEFTLCKVQYVENNETVFNVRLNYLHFRKPGHSFNLQAKFTLIKQLKNTHTADKGTLKFRLKRREEFLDSKT